MSISLNKENAALIWDNDESERTLIFREMMWGDVKTVLSKYRKEVLKSVFKRYYFKFDKRNKKFWKLILRISDDKIDSYSKRGFERDS